MDNNQLIVYLDKKKTMRKVVNILAEERGYNVNNKEYKTLLIDTPLLTLPNKSFIVSLFSPLSPRNSTHQRNRIKKPPKPIQDHDDCLKYLEYISHEITIDLERDIKRLQSNYLILSKYLEDAAERIRNLAEDYIPRYEVAIGLSNETVCDSIRQIIRLAVENHIVHLMHGKLMASIFNNHRRDDEVLSRKLNEIHRAKLTICQLGAQSTFSNFIVTDETHQELKRLSSLQSPLAVVSSLIKLVGLISDALNQSVKFKYLAGDCGTREEKVLICSDDLIASFVYVLANTKPVNLFCISRYLETFGWTSIAKDQAAYYTATFQIVIQYIYNYTSEQNDEIVSADNDDGADVRGPSISKTSLNILTSEFENEREASSDNMINLYKPLAKSQFIDSLDSRGSSEITESDSAANSVVAEGKGRNWEFMRVE